MKVHTASFKEQIKEMGRELDSIITFGDTVLRNEQLNAVTPSFQGAILKSVMKELEIDSNIVIPIGTTLNYKFGVKVNDEYEYLDFGNYVVYNIEKQEDTRSYKILCYDKMLFSMIEYTQLPLIFPLTIRDYINSLCIALGLQFKNANEEFANYDKIIESDLYANLGFTFRDIFDELAQVTASTICLNENDEVEIRYITETNDTIDEEFLKDVNVNFGEKYGPVNSIVLSRTGEMDNVYLKDDESVELNGLTELKIIDNQIMNFNNRSEYLPDILEKLNGLEYYVNDFVSTGICYYDLCDKYLVKIEENIYPCVMFNDEVLVTQGLQENIFTEMPEQTHTEYDKADKTDKKINRVYAIVNKQNQTITLLVETVEGYDSKIAQIELDSSTIKQIVSETQESVNDLGEQVEGVTTQMTSLITRADGVEIEINKIIEDGVDKVTTSNGYTFNENGLNIYKKNESGFIEGYNALHNTEGSYYKDGDTILGQITKDGSIYKDLVLYGKYYYGVDENLDVSNFTKSDAMFVSELYTDENGEEGFGHFYNGGA